MGLTVSPYWRASSVNLNERAYGDSHTMNAVRLRITLDILGEYTPGKLLDAGCGAGATTTTALDAGWDAVPIDFSDAMVAETNKHLRDKGYCDRVAHQASITDLSIFADNQFDAVICLGVLYYIERDDLAYRELCRVLKPGGVLICSAQNELFDLFTFNRYTRRFFRRHFFPLVDGGQDERADELDEAISSLLTCPDEPVKHDAGSARDVVFTRQENPLTFPEKLSTFNLDVVSGPYYHGIHLVPPLIEKRDGDLENESREKQYSLAQDWRGMFMAAHFLYEARKNGNDS